MNPYDLMTYLRYRKDAKRVRKGSMLTVTIPLQQAGIHPCTIKSLDGDVEAFLMDKFGGIRIKLLYDANKIGEGQVIGASANSKGITLNYKITEVYRK